MTPPESMISFVAVKVLVWPENVWVKKHVVRESNHYLPPLRGAISIERTSSGRLDALTGSRRVMYVFKRIVKLGLSRTSDPKYPVAALLRSPFPIVDCFQAIRYPP